MVETCSFPLDNETDLENVRFCTEEATCRFRLTNPKIDWHTEWFYYCQAHGRYQHVQFPNSELEQLEKKQQ